VNWVEILFITLALATNVIVLGWIITRPAFEEGLKAWAERQKEAALDSRAQSWIDGFEAGKDYERSRA
jgi:hypothetical protein